MTTELFYDIAQGSPEWIEIRRGIPTASSFQCLMAKSVDRKGRATYLRRLAAELITGEVGEGFTSGPLERGKEMEPEARAAYALLTDAEPRLVGFARDMALGAGASPDALLGDDGLLELKTQRADLLIETILKDEFPSEHYAQVQGGLLVTGRKWADICVYWPKLPLFIKRTFRHEPYLAELQKAIAEFRTDLDAMVKRVRAYSS